MSGLRRIANWIDFFVSLIASVYIFTVVLQMGREVEGFWRKVFTLGLDRHGAVVYAGLFLSVLLVIIALLRAVQHVGRYTGGRYLVFDTPNGQVSVRAGSVEEVINRTVRAMGEVADAVAGLDMPRGATVPSAVTIRCRLYNRPNLLAVQDQIRAVVRQCYLDMFPSEEPLQVQISVERIVFKNRPAQPKATPPPDLGQDDEGDAEPMRPQYPVDDGGK